MTGLSNPAVAYIYDAVGNTTSDGTYTYAYSSRNRLVSMAQAGSIIATYQYNALGQRVAKAMGSTTILFAYDEAGRLLGEYDATGAPLEETVWLNDTPVATLRKSGTSNVIHYVWADHLDTPRAITTSDAAMTLEWSWDSDPFGTTVPNEIALSYNLRFPGQYYDAEARKHYNYMRDYDPAIGRYLQSDPIGLKAGANTYGYVGSNPLMWIDPKGQLQKPGVGLGGNQRECPYAYRLELVRKPHWFVEEVTAQCFYYCGPSDSCPANPKDYIRSFIVYDIVRLRFWPGNPCPPSWTFDM